MDAYEVRLYNEDENRFLEEKLKGEKITQLLFLSLIFI